jgi:hypothetical protein
MRSASNDGSDGVTESKTAQRVLGVVLIFLGFVGTVWGWHTYLTKGHFFLGRLGFFLPGLAVIGFGFLRFPPNLTCRVRPPENGSSDGITRSVRQRPLWRRVFAVAGAAIYDRDIRYLRVWKNVLIPAMVAAMFGNAVAMVWYVAIFGKG